MSLGRCEMTYNYATWSQIHPSTRNNLQRKYSLYRFSNMNHTQSSNVRVKATKEPRRIVLFLPGHGGDYHQARSLFQRASETLFDLEDEIVRKDGNLYRHFLFLKTPSLLSTFDFLSIDFGEEATALLGGAAVRDQAEYVCDCISHIVTEINKKETDNVIPTITVVAHSMGGLAAKLASIQHNDNNGAISSLVTLSSPHLAPPIHVDGELARVYEDLKIGGWRWNNDQVKGTVPNGARNVALFAISGGEKDLMIYEPLTELNDQTLFSTPHHISIPPWFSISSKNIPSVGFSIDHQAILWCHQLVNPLALSVLLATSCGDRTLSSCSPQRRLELLQTGMGLNDVEKPSNQLAKPVISMIVGQDISHLFYGTSSLSSVIASFPVRFLSPFLVSLFMLSVILSENKLRLQIAHENKFIVFIGSCFFFLSMCVLSNVFGDHYYAHPVSVLFVTLLAFANLHWPLSFITSTWAKMWRNHHSSLKNGASLLFSFVTLFTGTALLAMLVMYEPSNGRHLIESFILLVVSSRSIIVLIEELVQCPQNAANALGASLALSPSFIGPIARALEILIVPFVIRCREEGLSFRSLEKGMMEFGFDASLPVHHNDRVLVTSALHLLAYPYFLKALIGKVGPDDDKHTAFSPRIKNGILIVIVLLGWNRASLLPFISTTIAIISILL